MLCIVGVVLGDGCAFILGLGDAVVKEQIITFAWLLYGLLAVLASCNFLLSAVLSWARGYDGFVIVDLLCWAGHVVMGGGIGLGEYGKCLMHFWVGFGIE